MAVNQQPLVICNSKDSHGDDDVKKIKSALDMVLTLNNGNSDEALVRDQLLKEKFSKIVVLNLQHCRGGIGWNVSGKSSHRSKWQKILDFDKWCNPLTKHKQFS